MKEELVMHNNQIMECLEMFVGIECKEHVNNVERYKCRMLKMNNPCTMNKSR